MSFWVPHNLTDIVTAAGVIGAVATVLATNRLRKTALAQEYIQRYWSISDRLDDPRMEADPVGKVIQVQRYLRLCEDEFELAALGFIDSRTWPVWHAAVLQAAVHDQLKPAIDSVLAEAQDAFELLRACRGGPDGHKAWACPAVRRRGAAAALGHKYLAWREVPRTARGTVDRSRRRQRALDPADDLQFGADIATSAELP